MKKLLITFVCLCLFITYFTYISYYSLDVTNYEIKSHKINKDINIVMIGDVHDYHCHIKDKVINKISELKPDAILCVGDMIDNQTGDTKDIIQFLNSLTYISDVYMSIGNHEKENIKGDKFIQEVKSIGITVLDKEYIDLNMNGNQIRIGGLYDYAFSTNDGNITRTSMQNRKTYQFLNAMTNTSMFQIMMAHRPDSFIYGNAYQWDIDLILSGHVHGGQVILPFIGGLYAPEQGWFPQYDYGEYSLKNSKLIITRGISSSGELLPRFNNPPEIVSIKIAGLLDRKTTSC